VTREPNSADRAIPFVSSDSEIIRRSLGEPRLFADLFGRHSRVIGAYAARVVGPHAAEDILSETFLTAFRRRKSYDHSRESARPWLLGIASRLLKRHHRDQVKQLKAYAAMAATHTHVSHDESESASERVDAHARVQALETRIAALSANDRETLLLYAWGDLTYEEIALALGIPVGTVRSRLNRVRRKLAPDEADRPGWDGGGVPNGPAEARA